MHDLDLIITLSVALAAALVLGYVTNRLRLSPILGYLLAGVAVGPQTPGFVADAGLAAQLAEIGVVLLMFGVGLHFHLKDLLAVRSVAVPGAIGQSLVATALGVGLAVLAGWGVGEGAVLGIGLSVASTVVLIRGLEDSGRLEGVPGRVAVGWLVVEDILTVLVLVLLPALGSSGPQGSASPLLEVGWSLAKIGLFAALVLLAGGRVIPWMLIQVARSKSRELFTLTVLVTALAIATVSATVFGVSMALGAFLAGMVVGQSRVSHQAAADALPLRDAFAVLFFVSVGMLFDFAFVVAHPGFVLGALAIVLLAKPLTAVLIVAVLGYSTRTALTVAIGLAQIGEFSFILAEVGRRLGMLPAVGHSVLVAVALISITLNPLLFRALAPIEAWIERRPRLWRRLNRGAVARGEAANRSAAGTIAQDEVHAVVAGFGPVGQTVTRILRDFGLRPVVVDLNVDTVTALARRGQPAVYGDASRADVLSAAGIQRARYLIVTLPDLPSRIPVVLAARELNPDVRVFVRARYLRERGMLEEVGTTAASYEEAEAAVALSEFLLRDIGTPASRIAEESAKIRDEFQVSPPPAVATEAGPGPDAR
jgi:CPA2 family monovalent cation:H+ antiporter-2